MGQGHSCEESCKPAWQRRTQTTWMSISIELTRSSSGLLTTQNHKKLVGKYWLQFENFYPNVFVTCSLLMCHWPVGCLEKHSVWSLVCESLVEQRMLEYVIQALATKHVICLWNLNLPLPLAQFQASYLLGHDCALKLQWTWGVLAEKTTSVKHGNCGSAAVGVFSTSGARMPTVGPLQDPLRCPRHRGSAGAPQRGRWWRGADFLGPTLGPMTWHLNDLPCLAGRDTKITRLFLGCVKCLVLCFSRTKSRRLLPGSFLLRMHRCRFGQLLELETFRWTNSWDSNHTAGTPSWPPQWTLQLVVSELLELEGFRSLERGRASNQHQQICHLDHLEPVGAVWIATKCVVYTFL